MIQFKAEKWDERALAERISRIVEGDTTWKATLVDKQKWQLDWNNNHLLSRKPELGEGVYEYRHRYWDAEEMAALAGVLKWLLGVEIMEVSKTSRFPQVTEPA